LSLVDSHVIIEIQIKNKQSALLVPLLGDHPKPLRVRLEEGKKEICDDFFRVLLEVADKANI